MSIFSMPRFYALGCRRPGRSSSVRGLVAGGTRVEVAAGLAGAPVDGAIEAVENRREVVLDVLELEVLLVQLVVALFAEPQQAVLLVREALALDHQADRTGGALRRVRHFRRDRKSAV